MGGDRRRASVVAGLLAIAITVTGLSARLQDNFDGHITLSRRLFYGSASPSQGYVASRRQDRAVVRRADRDAPSHFRVLIFLGTATAQFEAHLDQWRLASPANLSVQSSAGTAHGSEAWMSLSRAARALRDRWSTLGRSAGASKRWLRGDEARHPRRDAAEGRIGRARRWSCRRRDDTSIRSRLRSPSSPLATTASRCSTRIRVLRPAWRHTVINPSFAGCCSRVHAGSA